MPTEPIVLIVEDGSMPVGANSYVDAAYSDQYFRFTGRYFADWEVLEEEVKNILLYRAMIWLEEQYIGKWRGYIVKESQYTSFPRIGLYDMEGRLVSSSIIPSAVKNAQCEVARLFSTVPENKLYPTIKPEGQVRRIGLAEKAIEKEFFKTNISFEQNRYLIVEKKIEHLLKNKINAQMGFVPIFRG
jgi:hypothetical protein